jgi:DNA uptake protein ComE-like DNA-binding protein
MSLFPQFRIRLRLNSSSAPALAALPGLSHRTAKGIVELRQTRGRFAHRVELLDVPGIGWTTYLSLLDYITLDRLLAVGFDDPEP